MKEYVEFNGRALRPIGEYYSDGGKRLRLVDTDGMPYCEVSVCGSSIGYMSTINSIWVKNFSENAGVLKACVDAGILEDFAMMFVDNGFVRFPLHQITPDAMELWDK